MAFGKLQPLFALNPDYKNRVFGLDLMRALAIIFVVLGHGSMLEKANTNFPWIQLINGVELFFVLSGFLIGGILIKLLQNNPSSFKTIFDFWIRRWFRTLPNYYLVLLLNVLIVYFGIIKEDFSQFNWKFFFFLQNFATGFTGFFWESWSLSIEEWFYFLFPLVLASLFFINLKSKLSKRALYLTAVLIFLAIPFLFRFFIASKLEVDDFWLGVNIYKVVIYRLDGIAFGLLAAYIKFWHPTVWLKSKNTAFIAGIILSYLILYHVWEPNDFATKVYFISLQSLGCFLLLPKFDSIKTAPKLITKAVTHISLISYSMYLINLALVAEVIRDNFPAQNATEAWFAYGIYWIFVIVISTVMYKYFEKPITNLREKFSHN